MHVCKQYISLLSKTNEVIALFFILSQIKTKYDLLATGRSLPHVARHLSACVRLPEYKLSCLRYGKIVSEVQNSPQDMYLKLYSFTTVMFPNTQQHCALD